MTIDDFLRSYNLEKSLLMGFYGGGNYGDELLLEIIANLFVTHQVRDVTIAHQSPQTYHIYHHEFGFPRINMRDKRQVVSAVLRNRNIIVGGGGLWGMDMNTNVFLLSCMLFMSRFLLRKNVYLLGVGYYRSTPRLGRFGAWLAGKAATQVIARDYESYQNFRSITHAVSLDSDLAWHLPKLALERYQQDAAQLERRLHVGSKTIFITLRRLRGNFSQIVEQLVRQNQKRSIIVALLEPRSIDPEGFSLIKKWQENYPRVQVIDFSYNPVALFIFFRKYHDRLLLIAPQFHAILTAYLNHVTFLPIAYDNKVRELLKRLERPRIIPIQDLTVEEAQAFIDMVPEGAK